MSFKKILISVDSSEFSMEAAKRGLELAHQLHAKTALLYVVDSSKSMGSIDAGITPEMATTVLKKEVEETLDQLATMYNGNELMKFMPEGLPHDTILKTAETWEADLIVMGTHGRTGLRHLLVGSVAEHIIRESKIPVMVVPLK